MTTFAEKYNKGNENPFKFDLNGYDFTSLKELYNAEPNKVHALDGFYFTRGKFGVKVVVVMSDIKNGKVGFIVRKYESHGRNCHTITFKDK